MAGISYSDPYAPAPPTASGYGGLPSPDAILANAKARFAASQASSRAGLADALAWGDKAVDYTTALAAPPPAAPQGPDIAVSPDGSQIYMQGETFDARDYDKIIRSKARLNQPGTGRIPEGFNRLDASSYLNLTGQIEHPSGWELFKKNFGIGTDTVQQNIGRTAQAAGEGLGVEWMGNWGKKLAESNQEEIRKTSPYQRGWDNSSFGDYVIANLGQTAPQMLGAAAAGAVGGLVGGPAGAFGAATAFNYPQAAGDIAQRQVEETGRIDPGAAFGYGIPYAALESAGEAVPVATALGKIGRAGKRSVFGRGFKAGAKEVGKRIITSGSAGAITEGATEAGQQVLERQGAGLDLNNQQAWDEYTQSAIGGAVVGGLLSGAAGVGARHKAPAQTGEPLPTNAPADLLNQRSQAQPSMSDHPYGPPSQPYGPGEFIGPRQPPPGTSGGGAGPGGGPGGRPLGAVTQNLYSQPIGPNRMQPFFGETGVERPSPITSPFMMEPGVQPQGEMQGPPDLRGYPIGPVQPYGPEMQVGSHLDNRRLSDFGQVGMPGTNWMGNEPFGPPEMQGPHMMAGSHLNDRKLSDYGQVGRPGTNWMGNEPFGPPELQGPDMVAGSHLNDRRLSEFGQVSQRVPGTDLFGNPITPETPGGTEAVGPRVPTAVAFPSEGAFAHTPIGEHIGGQRAVDYEADLKAKQKAEVDEARARGAPMSEVMKILSKHAQQMDALRERVLATHEKTQQEIAAGGMPSQEVGMPRPKLGIVSRTVETNKRDGSQHTRYRLTDGSDAVIYQDDKGFWKLDFAKSGLKRAEIKEKGGARGIVASPERTPAEVSRLLLAEISRLNETYPKRGGSRSGGGKGAEGLKRGKAAAPETYGPVDQSYGPRYPQTHTSQDLKTMFEEVKEGLDARTRKSLQMRINMAQGGTAEMRVKRDAIARDIAKHKEAKPAVTKPTNSAKREGRTTATATRDKVAPFSQMNDAQLDQIIAKFERNRNEGKYQSEQERDDYLAHIEERDRRRVKASQSYSMGEVYPGQPGDPDFAEQTDQRLEVGYAFMRLIGDGRITTAAYDRLLAHYHDATVTDEDMLGYLYKEAEQADPSIPADDVDDLLKQGREGMATSPAQAKLAEIEEILGDLDTDMEKKPVGAYAKKLLKEGIIDQATVDEVMRILKDKDMGAEDATDELRGAVHTWAEEQDTTPPKPPGTPPPPTTPPPTTPPPTTPSGGAGLKRGKGAAGGKGTKGAALRAGSKPAPKAVIRQMLNDMVASGDIELGPSGFVGQWIQQFGEAEALNKVREGLSLRGVDISAEEVQDLYDTAEAKLARGSAGAVGAVPVAPSRTLSPAATALPASSVLEKEAQLKAAEAMGPAREKVDPKRAKQLRAEAAKIIPHLRRMRAAIELFISQGKFGDAAMYIQHAMTRQTDMTHVDLTKEQIEAERAKLNEEYKPRITTQFGEVLSPGEQRRVTLGNIVLFLAKPVKGRAASSAKLSVEQAEQLIAAIHRKEDPGARRVGKDRAAREIAAMQRSAQAGTKDRSRTRYVNDYEQLVAEIKAMLGDNAERNFNYAAGRVENAAKVTDQQKQLDETGTITAEPDTVFGTKATTPELRALAALYDENRRGMVKGAGNISTETETQTETVPEPPPASAPNMLSDAELDALLNNDPPEVSNREDEAAFLGDGMSSEAVGAEVASVTKGWKGGPGFDIYENHADIPEKYKGRVSVTSKGFYDRSTGRVGIIAKNNADAADVRSTIYHEALGHFGMAGRFNLKLNKLLTDMYHGNKAVRDAADAYIKRKGWEANASTIPKAVDETIAKWFESGVRTLSTWQKLKAYVRNIGREMGIVDTYSDNDVASIMHKAQSYAMREDGPVTYMDQRDAAYAEVLERDNEADNNVGKGPGWVKDNAKIMAAAGKDGLKNHASIVMLTNQLLDNWLPNLGASLAKRIAGLVRYRDTLTNVLMEGARHWAAEVEKEPQAWRQRNKGLGAPKLDNVSGFLETSRRRGKFGYVPEDGRFANLDQREVHERFHVGRKNKKGEWVEGPLLDPELQAAYAQFTPSQKKAVRDFHSELYKIRKREHSTLGRSLADAHHATLDRLTAREKEVSAQLEAAQNATTVNESMVTKLEKKLKAIKENREKAGARYAKQVRELARVYRDLEFIPYAPMQRHGKYVVVGTSPTLTRARQAGKAPEGGPSIYEMEQDPDHYFVHAVDTLIEAQQLKAMLDADPKFGPEGGGSNNYYHETTSPEEQLFKGSDVIKGLQKVMGNLDGSEERGINNIIMVMAQRAIVDAMSAHSSKKADLYFRGIRSAPLDMPRAFMSRMLSSAQFLSAFEYNPQIHRALAETKQQIGDTRHVSTTNRPAAEAAFNDFVGRYNDDLTPKAEDTAADWLTGAASIWMLTMTPSYYAQQLCQNMMITAPYLAGRFGVGKTVGAFKIGYAQVSKALEDTGGGSKGKGAASYLANGMLDISKVDPKYREVLRFAQNMGLLDVGMNLEMGRVSSDVSPGPIDKAMRAVRNSVRGIEATNRIAAMVAAYEMMFADGRVTPETISALLEIDPAAFQQRYNDYLHSYEVTKGIVDPARGPLPDAMSKEQFAAAEYARQVVLNTHGDYSSSNKQRWARTGLGRIATQFRTFNAMMIGTYVGTLKRAFFTKDLSVEERKVARRTLMYMTSTTALFAGAAGIPGAAIFGAIYAFLAGMGDDEEPPEDYQQMLREAVGDPFLANILLYGAPSILGLNVSGSMGMGNLFSLSPSADLPSDPESYQKYALALFGGPAVSGLGTKMFDAFDLWHNRGQTYQAMEAMLPRALLGPVRAVHDFQYGMFDRSGNQLVRPEDISAVETAWGAFGFQASTRSARQWSKSRAITETEYFSDTGASIKRDFVDAKADGDLKGMGEARTNWAALQSSRARFGLEQQSIGQLTRAPRARARHEAQTYGGIAYTKGAKGQALRLGQLAGAPQ